MKFTVNLARRPAENVRRTWIIWGGLLAVCFAVLLIMLTATVAGWMASRRASHEIARYRADIERLHRQEAVITAALQQPAAKAVLERSRYLNQLIDRKAVSWTHLFERLEAIMPPRVQLVALKPTRDGDQTSVAIAVAADNVGELLRFERQIESAPDFGDATVSQAGNRQGEAAGQPGRVVLEVVARYRPVASGMLADTSSLVQSNEGPQPSGVSESQPRSSQGRQARTLRTHTPPPRTGGVLQPTRRRVPQRVPQPRITGQQPQIQPQAPAMTQAPQSGAPIQAPQSGAPIQGQQSGAPTQGQPVNGAEMQAPQNGAPINAQQPGGAPVQGQQPGAAPTNGSQAASGQQPVGPAPIAPIAPADAANTQPAGAPQQNGPQPEVDESQNQPEVADPPGAYQAPPPEVQQQPEPQQPPPEVQQQPPEANQQQPPRGAQ